MSAQKENHLDNIFQAMGELKTFTIRQFLVMALIGPGTAYQLLSNVFISRNVPHRCAAVPNGSSLFTGIDEYPFEDLTVSYEECKIVVSHNGTVLKTEDCIYGMEYDKPRDTSVVSQFDLVCDHSSWAKLSQTLVIVGQGIGAAFFNMLSDRLGRKPVLVLCNMGLMVCGLTIAFSPNFIVFALFKFLVGAFQQGSLGTFSTLFLEMLSMKNRRLQAFWGGMTWGLSTVSMSFWAYILRDYSWRALQMTLSLCSIQFLFQWWYLKESLRWLIANGKTKAAVAYIREATNLNKTNYERTLKAYEDALVIQSRDVEEYKGAIHDAGTATMKLSLLDLLKVKRLLLNAVVLWSVWFTTALSFFAIYLASTSLAGDPYLNYFLTSLMEVPNNFVLYYIINRYGRKFTLRAIFITIGVGLLANGICRSFDRFEWIVQLETDKKLGPPMYVHSSLPLIFSLVAMTGSSASFAFIFFYTPEIFPTNMRSQALGVSSLMGRVGGMIAPFTGILSEKAKWGPGVLIGSLALIVCLLSIFLPETKGRELPQTIEDVKAWFSSGKEPDAGPDEDEETKTNLVE